MRKYSILIGLMLLFAATTARSEPVELQSPEEVPSDRQQMQDRAKEYACDCCQKCKAAKRPIKSKEEGPPATNGCKDCCERCDRVLPPDPEEIPPEIIKKEVPPEIKEKSAPSKRKR